MKSCKFLKFRFPLFTLIGGLILFSSCQDDDPIATDERTASTQAVNDEALTDDLFEDLDALSMEAIMETESGRISSEGSLLINDCVSRTVERAQDQSFSKTVTLTFDGTCEGPKGRIRTGTMLIDHSINFMNSTYTLSTTFQDFSINGHKIEGTRTLVYTAEENKVVSVNITLINGKITLEDGSVITRNGNFIRKINRESGEVSLSGSASGTNRNGLDYIMEISSPLTFKQACATDGVYMPVQGVKRISRAGKADITLNYGSGECDKNLVITADGEERTIEVNINRK
jgi:hypothetical protein